MSKRFLMNMAIKTKPTQTLSTWLEQYPSINEKNISSHRLDLSPSVQDVYYSEEDNHHENLDEMTVEVSSTYSTDTTHNMEGKYY